MYRITYDVNLLVFSSSSPSLSLSLTHTHTHTVVQAFQSYIDPEIEPTSSGGDGEDVALPLEENVLTCNLGVPIIVVCTKVI